jgi:hypothetical protein
MWDSCGDARPVGGGDDDEGMQTQSKAPEGFLHEKVAEGTASPSTDTPMNTTSAPTGDGDGGDGGCGRKRCKRIVALDRLLGRLSCLQLVLL